MPHRINALWEKMPLGQIGPSPGTNAPWTTPPGTNCPSLKAPRDQCPLEIMPHGIEAPWDQGPRNEYPRDQCPWFRTPCDELP